MGVLNAAAAEHDMVAVFSGEPLDDQSHFGKQRVVETGENAADDPGAVDAEPLRQPVCAVPVLTAQSQYALLRFFANAGGVVQSAGHGRQGNVCKPCDIFNRHSGHIKTSYINENGCINCTTIWEKSK